MYETNRFLLKIIMYHKHAVVEYDGLWEQQLMPLQVFLLSQKRRNE
jgi:hypothetical protein